jgi:hypothetical protein
MRNRYIVLMCVLVAGVAITAAFAQKMVEDTGWVETGFMTETATKKRPEGTIFRGSGVLTFQGKPPKPFLQHDMGAYELDPAPAADRNKPYNARDLNGVWELLPASSHGSLSTRVPPMTPKGWEMLEKRITASGPRAYISATKSVNNPELLCDPIGWPGVVYGTVRPVEMIQIPNRLIQHWAWHESWRQIWLDGRLLPKNPDPAFYGHSSGKWIGNTLVADTVGVDERGWIDDSGTVHSNNAVMQERWRRIDHNTLQFNMTLKDPEIYTETWESAPLLFQLYPNLEVDNTPCIPSEELMYRENTPTENPDAGKT